MYLPKINNFKKSFNYHMVIHCTKPYNFPIRDFGVLYQIFFKCRWHSGTENFRSNTVFSVQISIKGQIIEIRSTFWSLYIQESHKHIIVKQFIPLILMSLSNKDILHINYFFRGWSLPLSCCKTSLSSVECSSSKCPCSMVTLPRSFIHMGQRNPSLTSVAAAI